MLKNIVYGLILLTGLCIENGIALAEDSPTLAQVYQAAQSGRLDEAQGMMDKVLKEHPASAQAHFVEAEILAKQGQSGKAEIELNNAERLQPGLSFAKPQAVQELKNLIASTHQTSQPIMSGSGSASHDGFPWGMLLLGIAAIAVVFFIVRAMNARNSANFPTNYRPGGQYQNPGNMGMQPNSGNGMGNGMQPIAPAGGIGGMGSGIMGGLATGAAVGVGMVAGEALAHHFMDGNNHGGVNTASAPITDSWGASSNDMGGSNFGIADNSSWDSSSNNVADNDADVSGSDWS